MVIRFHITQTDEDIIHEKQRTSSSIWISVRLNWVPIFEGASLFTRQVKSRGQYIIDRRRVTTVTTGEKTYTNKLSIGHDLSSPTLPFPFHEISPLKRSIPSHPRYPKVDAVMAHEKEKKKVPSFPPIRYGTERYRTDSSSYSYSYSTYRNRAGR